MYNHSLNLNLIWVHSWLVWLFFYLFSWDLKYSVNDLTSGSYLLLLANLGVAGNSTLQTMICVVICLVTHHSLSSDCKSVSNSEQSLLLSVYTTFLALFFFILCVSFSLATCQAIGHSDNKSDTSNYLAHYFFSGIGKWDYMILFTMQPVCQRSNCIYDYATIKIMSYHNTVGICLFSHLLYFSYLSQNSDKINQ